MCCHPNIWIRGALNSNLFAEKVLVAERISWKNVIAKNFLESWFRNSGSGFDIEIPGFKIGDWFREIRDWDFRSEFITSGLIYTEGFTKRARISSILSLRWRIVFINKILDYTGTYFQLIVSDDFFTTAEAIGDWQWGNGGNGNGAMAVIFQNQLCETDFVIFNNTIATVFSHGIKVYDDGEWK